MYAMCTAHVTYEYTYQRDLPANGRGVLFVFINGSHGVHTQSTEQAESLWDNESLKK